MPRQLLTDCLNEIFEYLEEDKTSLHSCLYCEVAVRILWKNIWRYQISAPLSVISTLIACLPKESKDLLDRNGIVIQNWKLPLFNYTSFCKVPSIHEIDRMIQSILDNEQLIITRNTKGPYESNFILKIFGLF